MNLKNEDISKLKNMIFFKRWELFTFGGGNLSGWELLGWEPFHVGTFPGGNFSGIRFMYVNLKNTLFQTKFLWTFATVLHHTKETYVAAFNSCVRLFTDWEASDSLLLLFYKNKENKTFVVE